ncbi:MAG: hypothetical protein AAF922_07530 [Pseudomonadota bacterium]
MRKQICFLLIATLSLSSCSGWRDSGANPRNWFGGGGTQPSPEPTALATNPSDRQTGNPLIEDETADVLVRRNVTTTRSGGLFNRRREVVYEGTLVDQITDVGIEPLPTGVIVKVAGEPIREGAFDVRLLRVNKDGPVDGVLEYTLNALQPADFGRGTETTRRVNAAAFISNADLTDVREIRIVAARNARSVSP